VSSLVGGTAFASCPLELPISSDYAETFPVRHARNTLAPNPSESFCRDHL